MEITAKGPWLSGLGEVPASPEYFQGSMVGMLENNARLYPDNVACRRLEEEEAGRRAAGE